MADNLSIKHDKWQILILGTRNAGNTSANAGNCDCHVVFAEKSVQNMYNMKLGGGFKYFLCSSVLVEMIQVDKYFSTGLKPPTRQSQYVLLSSPLFQKMSVPCFNKLLLGVNGSFRKVVW